jgi:thioredoxin 2
VWVIRRCSACGQDNRVPARHLAHAGRCGACKHALEPLAEPLDVDERDFDDVVRNATVPVLVDFWAPWCGPCRAVAPEVKRAAERLAGKGLVLKVDTERHPHLSARFDVRGIPNFAVFLDGRRAAQQAGAMSHERLLALVAVARATGPKGPPTQI